MTNPKHTAAVLAFSRAAKLDPGDCTVVTAHGSRFELWRKGRTVDVRTVAFGFFGGKAFPLKGAADFAEWLFPSA